MFNLPFDPVIFADLNFVECGLDALLLKGAGSERTAPSQPRFWTLETHWQFV
ncbi:hypothetical protein X737_01280 [Mesorhizobium sp. L48C026A00]|nr:hypothetical protein X737_01280 [Mesorhizobium sp. L48C026A00]